MADMFTARPVSAAMGLGLRVPSAGFGADPATQSGLGSLRPTRADTAVVGTSVPPSPEQSIGGLRAGAAQQVEGLMSQPPLPARSAAARPPATVYFNQATNEMFAGDRAFKADDVTSALQAAQQPGNTTRPQGQGWAALPEGSFNDYLSSFSERRGAGELLGLGARQVAEGTIGGVGTLMEFGGATEAGPAVREFAQGVFGQDQNEQLRSALIAENSTLMQKIIDGTFQAIPTVASVVVGGGLVGLGARALGAGATGIRTAATVGGAGSTFPMHVSGYYDAAVRNGLDPNDPEIKTEILGGAFANTALDVLGISAASGKIISRALRQTVEESGKKAARSALRNSLTGAALTGFGEGLTETLQTLGETALFDPTVRDQWAAGDWKAMAPYLSKTYGDDYLVAAGVGAVLGGGMGGAANFRGTPGPAALQPEVDQTKPVDLNTTATGQAAEKEAPAALGETRGLGPVVPDLSPEEAALAADWQSDAALGPVVSSLGESEQALADQWRSTLGPLQLTPGQRVQPAPAAGTPMGRALLTQRQRADVAPTVPMMAPVAEARPGAMLLRPSERAQPAPVAQPAPAEAVGPAVSGLRISGVDQAIASGLANVEVVEDGKRVPFKNFALSVDGTTAEVGFVERDKGARRGVGYDAYVALGDDLAARGITLQSTPTLQADGRKLWERLVSGGKAHFDAQARRFKFGPAPAPATAPLTKAQKAAATGAAKASPKPAVLTKKQRAVAKRFLALTPEQQVAVVRGLGGTEAEVMALLRSNPDEVNAAIDRVVTPPDTTPTGGKKTTLKARTTKQPTAATTPTGTKGAGLKTKSEARLRTGAVVRTQAGQAQVVAATSDGAQVQTLRGTLRLLHGYADRPAVGPFVADPSGLPIERYDGGSAVYGTQGVYLDGDGKWTAGDMMAFDIQQVAEIDVPFKNALILSPQTAREITARVPVQDELARGDEISEWARANGHDGIIVTGFDSLVLATMEDPGDWRASDKVAHSFGMHEYTPQDQVIAFDPTTLRVVRDNLPFGTPVEQVSEVISRSLQTPANKKTGTKGAGLKTKSEATPAAAPVVEDEAQTPAETPVAEAAPEPTPAPEVTPEPTPVAEVQTPAVEAAQAPTGGRKPRTRKPAEAVTAVDELDADINDFITVLSASEDRANRNAAISGLQDSLTDSAMTPELRAKVRNYLVSLGAEAGAAGLSDMTGVDTAVAQLSEMIEAFNAAPGDVTGTWQRDFRKLAAAVRTAAPNAVLGDRSLRSYTKANGDPNFARVDGVRQIVGAPGGFSLANWNTIDGAVDLDGKPVTPMATGRVQLLVRNFVTKLARPPKVTVARNQADLKTKNPGLYARAVAARTQGDFDTAQAMGYSFGDGEVVVFSDRIGTEQQLQFVLAHETLGHYGLRAIMPAGKFDAAMEQVYKSDPRIAATVDQAVEVRGLSRAEATEEFLADHAAVLDMSLLRRVAGAIKTALNAVGFKFSDDMVRHLLRMSRRYVRNGKRDSLFTVEGMFSDISAIESGVDQLNTGRFKSAFAGDNKAVDLLVYSRGGLPRTADEVAAALKPAKEKLSLATENILRKAFSLTGFNALDNAGSASVNKVLSVGGEITAEIRNRGDAKLRFALNPELKFAGIKIVSGPTKTEQMAASRLNYGQQDAARGSIEARVASVTKALKDAGKPTRMFTISGDNIVDNDDTIAAYYDAGRLTLPEAKAILAKDDRYKKIADELTKTHPTWTAYDGVRETQRMADVEYVKAQYKALLQDRKNAIEIVESMLSPAAAEAGLSTQDKAMLRQAMDRYYEFRSDSAVVIKGSELESDASYVRARDFVRALNEAFVAEGFDTKKEDALRKFFDGKLADDFVAKLVDLRKRRGAVTPDNKFLLQETIVKMGDAEWELSSAEENVRQMLAQGYTPIVRREEQFQMRLVALDPETNEFVQLSDDARGKAAYRVFGTLEEATTLANSANATFADTTIPDGMDATDVRIITLADGTKKRVYDVEGRVDGAEDFASRPVVLRFDVSAAPSGIHTPLAMNLHEFLRGARRFGFDIEPSKLEKIVVEMTEQDARARKRLQQTGNPGYEVEGGVTAMEAMAQHVDARSSLIAKIQMRPNLDKLMNLKLSSSRKLWFGDKKLLESLKAKYDAVLADPTATEDVAHIAKQEYTDYAYKMRKTTTTVNGMEVNLGNKFYTENRSLLAFIDGNRDVNETDWGAGPIASFVRRWAGASQLGGTLTQPIMNNIGPFTNFVPWLATFNTKNGFGGGAGITNAYTQYLKAVSDVGGAAGLSFSERALKMHTGEYWNQVATGLETHEGVTKPEAEFISNETYSGILTPAQANSLLGASRNFTTNPAVRAALEKWMFFYVSSEQATRRAAALAAFRVEWQRQTSAIGKAPNDKLSDADYKRIHARASDFATQGVLLTLGDYGAKNRPAVWRSGFQSFLYMYKVWPTTTIQTLKRLSWPGKAMMLAPLLLAAGVAGLPFAEDGEDFVDTILQRTGSTTGSVRMELARLIDEVWPGLSPYVLKGGLSAVLGTDVAGRFSTGDFLPGTAGLLPGQELSATVREVLGPAWGFVEGAFVGGSQLAAAPFSDTATVVDAMRGGPVTLLRALGDAKAYSDAGAVIDKRGYVIESDVTIGMLIARVLGFTPASVASQYEVIRIAKRETNYQKQVVAKFRTALLKAEMSGDRVTAASIRRTVKEWNEVEKGTLLEIRNFEKNYQRLKKQASMSARERFMQSVGKNNRDAIELTNDLIGFD